MSGMLLKIHASNAQRHGPMSEKRLSSLNAEEIRARAERNESLTLKELAVWTRFSYDVVRSWQNDSPPLPMLNGKVFPKHFELWSLRKTGLESVPGNGAHRQMQDVGKSDELP